MVPFPPAVQTRHRRVHDRLRIIRRATTARGPFCCTFPGARQWEAEQDIGGARIFFTLTHSGGGGGGMLPHRGYDTLEMVGKAAPWRWRLRVPAPPFDHRKAVEMMPTITSFHCRRPGQSPHRCCRSFQAGETLMRSESRKTEARRDFLKTCGKFAVVTPPAMALLLSTTDRSYATASSGGGYGHGGRRGGHRSGGHHGPRRGR